MKGCRLQQPFQSYLRSVIAKDSFKRARREQRDTKYKDEFRVALGQERTETVTLEKITMTILYQLEGDGERESTKN